MLGNGSFLTAERTEITGAIPFPPLSSRAKPRDLTKCRHLRSFDFAQDDNKGWRFSVISVRSAVRNSLIHNRIVQHRAVEICVFQQCAGQVRPPQVGTA